MLRRAEDAHAVSLEHAKLNDCKGKSIGECDMDLDAVELQKYLKAKHAREAELLQVASTPRTMGTGALKREEANLLARNKEERSIHALLLANAKLDGENAVLMGSTAAQGKGTRKAVQGKGTRTAIQGKQLAAAVDETTQGNPPGALEDVPATVTSAPEGPHDFDGNSGIAARLPDVSFGESVLDSDGVEQRGSFTARKSSPYGTLLLHRM